jgi:hypothetical protein
MKQMVNLRSLTLVAWCLPQPEEFREIWRRCGTNITTLHIAVLPTLLKNLNLETARFPQLTEFAFTPYIYNKKRVDGNKWIPKNCDTIASFLNRHQSLIRSLRFDLDLCRGLRPEMAHIVGKIEHLTKLEQFTIRGTWRFPGPKGQSKLGLFIEDHSTTLRRLDISDNGDDDDAQDYHPLAPCFDPLSTSARAITSLKLRTKLDFEPFVRWLRSAEPPLTTLWFAQHEMSEYEYEMLVGALRSIRQLRHLLISINFIPSENQSLLKLADVLPKLETLKLLYSDSTSQEDDNQVRRSILC